MEQTTARQPEYFLDHYGHVYRWQATAGGHESMPVANFQGSGSAAECIKLIDKANSQAALVDALQDVALWLHDADPETAGGELLATVRAALALARSEA